MAVTRSLLNPVKQSARCRMANLKHFIAGCWLLVAGSTTSSAGAEDLTINSWGGSYQALQEKIVIQPFATRSEKSVNVLSDGEAMFAKAALSLKTGRPSFDVMQGDASWLSRGKQLSLWAKIDPDVISRDDVFRDAWDDYGVAALYWSFNIVVRTDSPAANGITNWRDLWNYAIKNPGRVALWGARPNYVLEIALMASGLPPSEVYPLDEAKVRKAYESLETIKDKVVWFETGDQGQRLLSTGEVQAAMFYGGDAVQLKAQGIPLRIEWNQGVLTKDYWMIMANAPHPDLAQKFLAHTLDPKVQSAFARATGYGPSNPAAYGGLADIEGDLPSSPKNKSGQLIYDYDWWGPHDTKMLEDWLNWLKG